MRVKCICWIILASWTGLTFAARAKAPIAPDQTYRLPYPYAVPRRPDIPKLCTYPILENPHENRKTYIAPKPNLSMPKIDIDFSAIGLRGIYRCPKANPTPHNPARRHIPALFLSGCHSVRSRLGVPQPC